MSQTFKFEKQKHFFNFSDECLKEQEVDIQACHFRSTAQ